MVSCFDIGGTPQGFTAAYQIAPEHRGSSEVPFRVLKRQFGHVKMRYRGLTKNGAQLFTLFALGNLFLVRRRLLT